MSTTIKRNWEIVKVFYNFVLVIQVFVIMIFLARMANQI